MKTKCEHCGKMTDVMMGDGEERDAPEVEIKVEGDPDSIKALLQKLVPADKKAA